MFFGGGKYFFLGVKGFTSLGKIFVCHIVSLEASTTLLISQTPRAFWTPRTT